jgi:hypothetical protein
MQVRGNVGIALSSLNSVIAVLYLTPFTIFTHASRNNRKKSCFVMMYFGRHGAEQQPRCWVILHLMEKQCTVNANNSRVSMPVAGKFLTNNALYFISISIDSD